MPLDVMEEAKNENACRSTTERWGAKAMRWYEEPNRPSSALPTIDKFERTLVESLEQASANLVQDRERHAVGDDGEAALTLASEAVVETLRSVLNCYQDFRKGKL